MKGSQTEMNALFFVNRIEKHAATPYISAAPPLNMNVKKDY